MIGLDKNRIFNGTPKKRIQNAHQVMKESYSEDSAREYHLVYSQYPIQTVLENSRYIFSEPMFGLPYYKKIMESGCVPFETYETEMEKIQSYMESYQDKMNEDTKELYQSLYEDVSELYQDHIHCVIAESSINEPLDKVWNFCNESYQFITGTGDYDTVVEAAHEMSPLAQILYIGENVNRLDMDLELLNAMDSTFVECGIDSTMDDFSSSVDAMMLATLIAHDKCIRESVQHSQNPVLRDSFSGLYLEDGTDFVGHSILSNLSYEKSLSTDVMESVNELFDERLDPFYTERTECKETEYYDAVLRKYIAFEHCLDYLKNEWIHKNPEDKCTRYDILHDYAIEHGYDPDMNVDTALALCMEATSELEEQLVTMEYTKDGTASLVIRRHATTQKEKNPDRKTKPSEKSERWKTPDPDEIDDDEEEDDLPKSNKKPKLAKKDLHTRVQAAALDADVKVKTGGSMVKKVASDVVQTGKAVLKIPGNMLNGIKSLLDGWKGLDDNKRAEYMMKPGYRKKWFKSLKWAIQYGLAAFISPLMIPVVWFCRKASKEKNQFLQNELAAELATEIKVCEEKINDANNSEDRDAKYQLMRTRDKLEKERIRVIANAKYV